MLRAIEAGNVRIFAGRKKWKFDLSPLTILCGTNSAGKSTLAKIPLLIRQSQGIGEALQSSNGQLRLVGSQLDLGTFRSFVSNNDSSRDVEVGISFDDLIPRSAISAMRLWKAQGSRTGFAPPDADDESEPYTLNARFTFGLRHPVETRRRKAGPVDSSTVREALGPPMLKRAVFELHVGREKLLDWQVGLVPNPVHEALGPPRYELVVPKVVLKATGWLDAMDVPDEAGSDYTTFPANLTGILPSGILVRLKRPASRAKTSRTKRIERTVWPLPYVIGGAIEDLKQALTRIHYLGPLRAPAKRYYVAENSVDPGMDAAGEFLPYVLRDRGEDDVTFCPPGEMTPRTRSLSNALDSWISYLRTGIIPNTDGLDHEISVAATKDVLVEFNLRSFVGGRGHALADSGFGYSQVLPILVRGLIAGPNSTLIVEQPELHLNPALQIRLAEFFVGLAQAGKQVIIETHSEHIVNAMRVVAAETGQTFSTCGVYFLDAPHGEPHVHRLSIQDDGSISEWPMNFFGETANLRARLLRAQKKYLSAGRDR